MLHNNLKSTFCYQLTRLAVYLSLYKGNMICQCLVLCHKFRLAELCVQDWLRVSIANFLFLFHVEMNDSRLSNRQLHHHPW